jgi:hypothetical protein
MFPKCSLGGLFGLSAEKLNKLRHRSHNHTTSPTPEDPKPKRISRLSDYMVEEEEAEEKTERLYGNEGVPRPLGAVYTSVDQSGEQEPGANRPPKRAFPMECIRYSSGSSNFVTIQGSNSNPNR